MFDGHSNLADGRRSLVYGLRAGALVHVQDLTDERNGLRCGCVCPDPGCGARLVARRGHRTPHYAHWSPRARDGGSAEVPPGCNGPETALHRLAKDVVVSELRLCLPDHDVRLPPPNQRFSRLVRMPRELLFESALAEVAIDRLRPDVLATFRGRPFWVEIRVRHAVPPEKLADIRAAGQTAIEIDLSGLPLDADRFAIREAVLDPGLVTWLHHAKLNAAVAELQEKLGADQARRAAEKARAEQQARVADRRAVTRIREALGLPWKEAPPSAEEVRVKAAGLSPMIDRHISGSACFIVPPRAWQSKVLCEAVLNPSAWGPIQPGPLLVSLVRADMLKPGMLRQDDVARRDLLVSAVEGYRDPAETLQAYLDALTDKGLLRRQGGVLFPVDAARNRAMERERRAVLVQRSFDDATARARNGMPEFREWLATPIHNGRSPREMLDAAATEWSAFASALQAAISPLDPVAEP